MSTERRLTKQCWTWQYSATIKAWLSLKFFHTVVWQNKGFFVSSVLIFDYYVNRPL